MPLALCSIKAKPEAATLAVTVAVISATDSLDNLNFMIISPLIISFAQKRPPQKIRPSIFKRQQPRPAVFAYCHISERGFGDLDIGWRNRISQRIHFHINRN